MKLEKIGAIGDIHAEDERLSSALHFFAACNVDRVLSVGDIVDGLGDLVRCCELLQANDVDVVRGNHDRWLLEGSPISERASRDVQSDLEIYLRGLPTTRRYDTVRGQLLLCHGLGDNDMNRLTPDDYGYAIESNDELQALIRAGEYAFVVCGHTHRRMVKAFEGVTIINVGTLFREHEPMVALVDFASGEVEFYEISDEGVLSLAERHSL